MSPRQADTIRVRIFGPNLRSAGPQYHVHAEGCADCRHYGPGRRFGGDEDDGWAIELPTADLHIEATAAIYGDVASDYGPAESPEWWAAIERNADDVRVFPCVAR